MHFQHFLFRKHLEDDEEIYFVAHKHWIDVLPKFLNVLCFGFLVPWFLYFLFPALFWVAILWSLIALSKMIYDLCDWYLDAWLATSQSIIDTEWKGLFHYTSSRVEYPSIEGVSYEIVGFWGTFLSFGQTQIDRVSSTNPIILPYTHNPKKVEMKVLECKERFIEEKSKTDSDVLKDILSDMVSHHVRKHGWKPVSDSKLKKVRL